MEDLRELWAAIKPRTKEEKRRLLLDIVVIIGIAAFFAVLIYIVYNNPQ